MTSRSQALAYCFGVGTQCSWKDNILIAGAGNEHRGGGVFISGRTGFHIRGKIFVLNGPVKDGGGLYFHDCHDVLVSGCAFLLNFAKWGGGIYLERCTNVTIERNLFLGNFALRDGGAVSVSYSRHVSFGCNALLLNFAMRSHPVCDIHQSAHVTFNGGH